MSPFPSLSMEMLESIDKPENNNESLKVPGHTQDKFIEAVKRSTSEGYGEIRKLLVPKHNHKKEALLRLSDMIDSENRTVFSIILEDVINGHILINEVLNEQITFSQCPECENTDKAVVNLIFDGVLNSADQTRVIKDVHESLTLHTGCEFRKKIFEHPLIYCLILLKWEKLGVFFFSGTRAYMVFVMLFSIYIRVLTNVFSGTPKMSKFGFSYESDQFMFPLLVVCCILFLYQILALVQSYFVNSLDPRKVVRSRKIRIVNVIGLTIAIVSCVLGNLVAESMSLQSPYLIPFEMILILFWLYMLIREITEIVILSKKSRTMKIFLTKYCTNPENHLEWLAIISVVVCFLLRFGLIDKMSGLGFVSVGICAAWIQMIFVLGQPSRTFLGDFIVMFYNTIKVKVWYYVQIVILFLVGFDFAFWILHHGTGQTDIMPGEGFSDFWESLLKSGAMAVGELNFGEFYNLFKDSKSTRIFAMLIMSILVITGTVVLTNLLIASIIQDYSKMKQDVDFQNLQFMAKYVIHMESLVTRHSQWMKQYVLIEPAAKYCPHDLCSPQNCTLQQFPSSRDNIHTLGSSVMKKVAKQTMLQKLFTKKKTQSCGCQETAGQRQKKMSVIAVDHTI